MNYHKKTIKLISMPYSVPGETEVARFEEKYKLQLPLSVREWFSEIDGQSILSEYSNCDDALHPKSFRVEYFDDKELLVFMHENQCVCWWAVELGEEHDPTVWVNIDLPSSNWQVCSYKFSEFVYTRVFDFAHWKDGLLLIETKTPVTNEDISELESNYCVEPRSYGWPSSTAFRFSNGDKRITIWSGSDQADWVLSASSLAELRELREKVEPIMRDFA